MNAPSNPFTLTYPTRADLERLVLSFAEPATQVAAYRPTCIHHLS
jgi:hypothetical protein